MQRNKSALFALIGLLVLLLVGTVVYTQWEVISYLAGELTVDQERLVVVTEDPGFTTVEKLKSEDTDEASLDTIFDENEPADNFDDILL